MKDRVKLKKIISFLIPILLTCVFILSLIPILQLSKYDFASGDDYGYGWRAHQAWVSTGSLWATLKAGFVTIKAYYDAWQGTWFTILLMALQPEVFSPDGYWVTTWIMTAVIIASTTVPVGYLCKRYAGMPREAWISIDLLVLLAMIQCFPSKKSSLYWYNGCAHYIYPYALAMIAVWAIMKFRDQKKKRHFAVAAIMMTLLGGSSYIAPLVTVIVLVYLWAVDIIHKKNRHMLWMIIPFVLEFAGLAISYASPGNNIRAQRQGDTTLSFSAGTVIGTVLESFKMAFEGIYEYLVNYPFAFICLIGVGIIAAYILITCKNDNEEKEDGFRFGYPILFVVLMFCIYAASYAPGVFSQAALSGGVPNTIFQVFILTFAASIVYVVGWFATHIKTKKEVSSKVRLIAYMVVIFACFVWMALTRSTLKNTTSYMCYSYISSGQAADYRSQIQYNYSLLLDDSLSECVLCPVNDEQGPLMHMPVVNDRDAFTNLVVRQFFGKEKLTVDPSLQINAEK